MPYGDNREQKGCAPTPGMMIGLALVVLWMWKVVPAYRDWMYPPPPPGQETEEGLVDEGTGEGRPRRGPREEGWEGEPAIRPPVPAGAGEGMVPGLKAAEALAERASRVARRPADRPPGPEPPADLPEELGPAEPEREAETIEVETDELVFEFSTLGASIERAALRDYHSTPKDTEPLRILMPLSGEGGGANSFVLRPAVDLENLEGGRRGVDLSKVVWKLEEDTGDFDGNGELAVTFTTTRGGIGYRKTFVLRREGLVFDLEIEAENRGPTTRAVEFDLVGANGIVPDDVSGGRRFVGMLAVLAARTGAGESLETRTVNFKKASKGDLTDRGVSMALNEWVAVKNRYFAVVCQAEDPKSVRAVYAEAVKPDEGHALDPLLGQNNMAGVMHVWLGKENARGGREVAPGETARARFQVYLGPMQGDLLRAEGPDRGWDQLIDFGWFGWISKLLLGLLKVLHVFTGLFGRIVGGYGLAIVLLTLVVKGAMFPVTRRSMTSMHKMQKLAPEQAAIKKRYGKDKSPEAQRRMQAEIMGLYKEHGVSPLGGCLPMLIQIPMFFALFGMLRNAFELRQEPYLWIRDLTQPEHVVGFGTTLPVLGDGLNLLPLVYLGLMLLQQRLQPKPADPQAQQQQKMMRYMFFIFPFLLYNMPSGLILYFVFSSAFGILEQWLVRRGLEEGGEPAVAGAVTIDGRGTVGPAAADGRDRSTAWDKQDKRHARKAEKRKKKRKERDARAGPE